MSDPSHSSDKIDNSTEPHYFQWGLTAFCVIVASVLVFYLLGWLPFIWTLFKKLVGILGPFILGFVMAYLLLPIFNGMYRRIQPRLSVKMKNGTRFAKGLCSILTLLGRPVFAGAGWKRRGHQAVRRPNCMRHSTSKSVPGAYKKPDWPGVQARTRR